MHKHNTVGQLAIYFSSLGNPVYYSEFREFWFSLTPSERDYYRLVDLKTGLISRS